MRILFPMPPEPQSVIKIAGTDGRIAEARIENIEGEIRSGTLFTFLKYDNIVNFLVNRAYLRYFSNLMAHSFREIIDFSKNIPEFKDLALQDQIALIKGSCIEMLFIKVVFKTPIFIFECKYSPCLFLLTLFLFQLGYQYGYTQYKNTNILLVLYCGRTFVRPKCKANSHEWDKIVL